MFGWRTNRKIIVVESDDWGSIRTPSREVYEKMVNQGLRLDNCEYSKYDALESDEDLSDLLGVLENHRSQYGKSPIFTLNMVIANPDFDRIKDSGFINYFYEPFTETYSHYPLHRNAYSLLKEGIKKNLVYPQFHSREHLNVKLWLKMLQSGSSESRMAFENRFYAIGTNITKETRKSYLAALDFEEESEINWQKESLVDGLKMFEMVFGYKSKSFVATNNIWHPEIEATLADNGILYIQGVRAQMIPQGQTFKILNHELGSINCFGQIYLIRNCFFEPSLGSNVDWVRKTLKQIRIAFLFHKPAVISSHRLNYIGFIDPGNRRKNLIYLKQLLELIQMNWPDVEFLTSSQLGDLIYSDIKRISR